jgi:hypothetical protein
VIDTPFTLATGGLVGVDVGDDVSPVGNTERADGEPLRGVSTAGE